MNTEDPTPRRQNRMTAYLPQYQYSCLSPFLLFLFSSNLGTRFRLRGVDLSHPEISQFQDVNRKIIKQEFSHNLKKFLNIYFVYKKSSVGKSHCLIF
jgi:hypothetical protein